ncbi:MAG: Do family serine endopeptidase [Planctomycetaceae bacterium]
MASFDPQDFGLDEPPPRPTTPPVRRGFLLVLSVLCLLAGLVYGIPYVAGEAGYAWEAGRSRAAAEALVRLDKVGVVDRASELFRMATIAVSPAVVHIKTQRFRQVGGFPGVGNRFGRGFESVGLGSGVIIDKEHGYIVTNNHVVKDADAIVVRLSQGSDVPARLLGADPKTDLAVLQVKAGLKAAAEWGDSDKLDIGDWVLAIGSPFALDHTVTAGIISATQRNDLQINEYESFIQTDAAINPGNSGGPLIDLSGKVIGINTAIISPESGGYVGIGLAIPSSMAKRVVEGLLREGKIVRGYLGVRIQPLSAALAKEFKLPDPRGSLVVDVQPGSPASKAGLQVGDVIVKLDGKDVPDPASLRNQTASLAVDSKVPLTYYREGKQGTVQVTIAELPTPPVIGSLGFRVRELPPGESGPESSAVVIDQVVAGSLAFRAGLRPGMQIVAVGRTPVKTMAEYDAAIAAIDLGQGLPLRIMTPGGQSVFVSIGGPGVGQR